MSRDLTSTINKCRLPCVMKPRYRRNDEQLWVLGLNVGNQQGVERTGDICSIYCGLNVCVPQNSYVEILIPTWWYLEMGPLGVNKVMRVKPSWMGLVPLQEEARELVSSLSVKWGHKETVLCERVSRASPDTKSAGTLNLDFPTSRTVRNKCLLFKPIIYGIFVTAAQMDSDSL